MQASIAQSYFEKICRCPKCKGDWSFGWSMPEFIQYVKKGISYFGRNVELVKCIYCQEIFSFSFLEKTSETGEQLYET
jgi:hypothetical protein